MSVPSNPPACPVCSLENTYPDGDNFVCPDCAHEWPMAVAMEEGEEAGDGIVRDANGNPLADLHTNANDPSLLKIPCTTVGSTEFNGCPSHMATFNGQKYVSYDVAAWADLWFYSNPIYIEVKGSTVVAGVK